MSIAKSKHVTQEELKDVLDYNPETGIFKWKRGRYRGNIAGSINKSGYPTVRIGLRQYYLHRLAILFISGNTPARCVDHLDRDKTNNRLDNLRVISKAENNRNMPRRKDNTSGETGVFWNKRRHKWIAQIKHNGRQIYLGSFDDILSAAAARKSSLVMFGFHETHGE